MIYLGEKVEPITTEKVSSDTEEPITAEKVSTETEESITAEKVSAETEELIAAGKVSSEKNAEPSYVLLLNGSPHCNGSTATALEEVAGALERNGVHTEIVQVGHLAVRSCMACGACAEIGKCVIDDIVNEIAPKFEKADGLVVGSPVYYASANATLVACLTRLFYSTHFDKRMKVGASVVSARRGGCSASFDELNKFFTISGMPVASSQYWNSIHGNNADEAKQDGEGLQIMRTLGNNMAFLIKSIAMGKEMFGLPELEERIGTNFIR
nr:flavodoxin family protein [Clostridium sp. OM05-9BH]